MSTYSKHILIALYDATYEGTHLESPVFISRARALGVALASSDMGIIARMAPHIVKQVFSSISNGKATSIALSPAANKHEHEKAFRLSTPDVPMIFTGRGALGADTIALASAQAVLIFGSQPKLFESMIDHVKHSNMPIGVLSDENVDAIYKRVCEHNPHLAHSLFISHDPETLVRSLVEEFRRRELSQKLS